MERIAIIGFGCAGFQALRSLRQAGSEAQVTVFTDTGEAPANPMLTTYYAAGKIGKKNLYPFGTLEEIKDAYRAEFCTQAVQALDGQTKCLTLADGTQAGPFDKILLATGAQALVPPLGVVPGKRVLCMRTVEDAELLRARLAQGDVRSALVVGGSMVGIKVAELFSDKGIDCTLADMAEKIFPLSAFPTVAEEIERRIGARGVKLRFGSGVQSAEELSDGVLTRFADGGAVKTDLLLLCIGTRACVGLAKDAGLAVGRGILVDEHMGTSVPGIYAAGDCCESRNLLSGQSQIIGLWANAGWQGQAAGSCMAEKPMRFEGNIIHNITHFMGMDFVSLGDVHAQGRRVTLGAPRSERYIEAVVDEENKLLCVNLLDSYHLSGVIKNYMLNRFSGNTQPLPPVLRGLLAREGMDEAFISLFEGGVSQ